MPLRPTATVCNDVGPVPPDTLTAQATTSIRRSRMETWAHCCYVRAGPVARIDSHPVVALCR
jgi:hypothetical protein